ncbi:hypothetical protein [uncultured Clostridium sp.]|uniref:hypothetical protein n=1 Tax=uncultured Clostridium sp. TaxID=59620 RepID=UPI00321769A6
MNKKYSVIKEIVVWIIIDIIGTIILVNTINISKISVIIISIIATVPILIARYNNYKLVIYDKEIVLYKSFIKETRIQLENIVEIEIGNSFTGSRLQGVVKYMYIKTAEDNYKFNIVNIESEQFYDDIKNLATKLNIRYFNNKE